jgi:hypothetical protein
MPRQDANDPRVGVERGDRGEAGGEQQPNPRRHREPGADVVEQDPGCGERVQSQEARAGQQRHRDEEGPVVVAPGGGLAGDQAEPDVHGGHGQHQPEMGGMVLPAFGSWLARPRVRRWAKDTGRRAAAIRAASVEVPQG